MANIELKLLDFHVSSDYIKVVKIDNNKTPDKAKELILIKGFDSDNGRFVIYLDKSTAIKFAKTLRTEINKIKD